MDAPEGVVPVVALHQFGVSGGKQPAAKVIVLGELGANDLLHDADLHLLPVASQGYLPPKALGLVGGKFGEGYFFLF